MKENLAERIQLLTKLVNESNTNYQQTKLTLETIANNHNMLVGRLSETKELYEVVMQTSLPSNKAEKEKQKG